MSAVFRLPADIHMAPFSTFCSPVLEIDGGEGCSPPEDDCEYPLRHSPEVNCGNSPRSPPENDRGNVLSPPPDGSCGSSKLRSSSSEDNSGIISSYVPEGVRVPVPEGSRGPVSGVSCSPVPGLLSLTHSDYCQLLASGSFSDHYHLLDSAIASGQWTSVYKCAHTSSGEKFIAKFCRKLRNGVNFSHEAYHEVAVMLRCRGCSYIARLHEIFDAEDDLILVMELIEGGDLQYILDDDQVPYESDVVRYVSDILHGLQFLHQLRIAHLDVKPQNVVLTGVFPEAQVKLCDLEVARLVGSEEDNNVRGMLGTPDYVAPEILRMDTITLAADIWSVGVLVYVLLTGFTPFGGDTDAETFRNISLAQVDFPDELFEDISDAAKDWVKSCLALDPRERPSVDQLLEHPWLQDRPASDQCPVLTPLESSARASEQGSTLSVCSLSSCGNSEVTLAGSVRSLASSCTSVADPKFRRILSKSREAIAERAQRSCLNKCRSKLRKRISDPTMVGEALGHDVCRHQPLAFRTSEPMPTRPRWRTAGAPLDPLPGDRVNSFWVRDQYQNKVAAGLVGAGVTGSSHTPFVRRCSLRGTYDGPKDQSTSPTLSAVCSVGGEESKHNGDATVSVAISSTSNLMIHTGSEKEDVFTRLYNDKIAENKRKLLKSDNGNKKPDSSVRVDELKNDCLARNDSSYVNSNEILQKSSEAISMSTGLNPEDSLSAKNSTCIKKDPSNHAYNEASLNRSSLRKLDSQSSSRTVRRNSSASSSCNVRLARKFSVDERRSSFHYIKNNKKPCVQKQSSAPITTRKTAPSSTKIKTEDKYTNTDDSLLLPFIEETIKSLSMKGNEDNSLATLLKPDVMDSLEKLLSTHMTLLSGCGRVNIETGDSVDTVALKRFGMPADEYSSNPLKNSTVLTSCRSAKQDRRYSLQKSVTDTNLSSVNRGICTDNEIPYRPRGHLPETTSIEGRRYSLSSDLGSSDTVSDTAESQCSSLDIRELSAVTDCQGRSGSREADLATTVAPASGSTRITALQRRQSCSGVSVLGTNPTQPWRALCSGSVSRAVNMFSGLNRDDGTPGPHRRKSEPFQSNDVRAHVDLSQS